MGFALCLPVLLASLLAWVKVTFLFPPVMKLTSNKNDKHQNQVGSKEIQKMLPPSIMEREWRLKSSLQSSEESKDVSGTYAAYSTRQGLEPSILRECQFEEFGIKNESEIEIVLAESKCYISTE